MRFAFLGHSHHRTTGSSSFFLEQLRQRGPVETFWDSSWLDGGALDLGPIVGDRAGRGAFDAVVVWQVEALAERLAPLSLPNVTFVPMYDGCHAMPDAFWRSLGGMKVLCFSSTLFERLQRLGLRCRHARYYPDPDEFAPVTFEGADLAAFFWQRQQDVTWRTLRPLLGEPGAPGAAPIRAFTLHRAMDPSFGELTPPAAEDVRWFGIRHTDWFPDREALRRELAHHQVYFAPRLREGIGLSFLEAMAMGMLVVAPDQPTMSEYLVSGVNGLLYDAAAPRPLDFSRAAALGAAARRSVARGHARWRRSVERVLEFVERPAAELPARAGLCALDPCALPCPAPRAGRVRSARRETAPAPREGGARLRRPPGAPAPAPTVTVAVVTRDAAETLGPTLESIVRQTFTDREILVLDGGSADGTVDVIRAHEPALAYWRSEPDGGPYEAMNAAARLAAGRYVLFMNAGDAFHTTDALASALEGAPPDADVIYGHHVYRHPASGDELHLAAAFEETWARLRAGDVGWRWLGGVPGHQATLTRTELLRRHPYSGELRLAADHDLLYRLAREGARFHHADVVLATYVGGGLSWQRLERCFEEWRRIALAYTERPEAVARAFAAMHADVRRDLLARQPWGRLLVQALWRADARAVAARRLRSELLGPRLPALRPRRTRRTLIRAVEVERDGVRALTGFARVEPWGSWLDGTPAAVELLRPIRRPRWITLRVAQGPGPTGQELLLRVGKETFRHALSAGEQRLSVKLQRGNRAPLRRLELEARAVAGPTPDGRRPSIALRAVEIESRRW